MEMLSMVKRNDPCWCGSGKKYKKCHMRDDQEKVRKGIKRPESKKPSMIKTDNEIEGMRKAGAFNGELIDYIRPFVKEGISTEALNNMVHRYTKDHGHTPATLGYHGFPKSSCISINNVVCHGIPSEKEYLKDGDIVNVDLTTIVDGFHGDSSETFIVGEVSPSTKKLVRCAGESLLEAIATVQPGIHLSEIASAIQPFVESQGFSIVRQYTGHGIGRKFHENFSVLHHADRDCDDVILRPGMTFTIEPMVNAGEYKVLTDRKDKWTVRTKDGSLSAQFEHTILVTQNGAEVLTRTPSQIEAGTLLNLP